MCQSCKSVGEDERKELEEPIILSRVIVVCVCIMCIIFVFLCVCVVCGVEEEQQLVRWRLKLLLCSLLSLWDLFLSEVSVFPF